MMHGFSQSPNCQLRKKLGLKVRLIVVRIDTDGYLRIDELSDPECKPWFAIKGVDLETPLDIDLEGLIYDGDHWQPVTRGVMTKNPRVAISDTKLYLPIVIKRFLDEAIGNALRRNDGNDN